MKRAIGVSTIAAIAITGLFQPGIAFAEEPTYTRDIAPIFREKCEACHRPGYIAPMSLQTYQEVRPWARSIKNRVETRQMPPWHIDPAVGIQEFKNDRSMTREGNRPGQSLGGRRRPAGQPGRPPAPGGVCGRRRLELR